MYGHSKHLSNEHASSKIKPEKILFKDVLTLSCFVLPFLVLPIESYRVQQSFISRSYTILVSPLKHTLLLILVRLFPMNGTDWEYRSDKSMIT